MKKISKNFLEYIFLSVIFFTGAFFRLQGILTSFPRSDEIQLSKTGMFHSWRTLFRLNPHGTNSPFYHHLLFLVNHLYFLMMKITGIYKKPYEIYVEYIINPFKFIIINRFLNLFLGSLLPILVYFLAVEIYRDKKTGIIASLLIAFNPFLINYSRLNLLEISISFLSLLTIHFSYKIFKARKNLNYYLAGISLGLVLTSKMTGLFCAPLIFMAHFLKKDKNKKNLKQKILDKNLYISYFLPVLIYFLFQPALIRNAFNVLIAEGFNFLKIIESLFPLTEAIKYQNQVVKYGWLGLSRQESPFVWILPVVLRFEPRLGYLYLISLIYAILRFKKENFLILISVIISIFWFGRITTMGDDVHYLIPIMPLVVILTAKLLSDFGKLLKILKLEFLIWGIIAFFVYPNFLTIKSEIKQIKRIDTRILASQWIKENVPAGKKICLTPYSPYIFDPDNETYAVRGKDELVIKKIKEKTRKVKWYKTSEFQRKGQFPQWPKNFTKKEIDEYSKIYYLYASFSYYYPDIEILKKEKTDYLVFSSIDYEIASSHDPYPKSNPLYYLYLKRQKSYKSVFEDQGKNLHLVKEFESKGQIIGPKILIFKLKY